MQTLKELQEQSRWLLRHASNVTSQCGEDGIIAKALELMPERNRWCIEFGAWDGRKHSNTYNLITAHGYRGVLIEANAARFQELQRTHDRQKHVLINAVVGFEDHDSLDALLHGHPVPADVDLLSIDIDGNDYHAWNAIRSLRPKLVVVEFNPTIPNHIVFIQKKGSSSLTGTSPAALIELGRSKGYELIAAMPWNLVFVDARYFGLFNIPDNSLAVMRDEWDIPYMFYMFVGYDGHVFLDREMVWFPWHPRVSMHERDIQILPARLQKPLADYTRFDNWLFEWWLRFHRRGIL